MARKISKRQKAILNFVEQFIETNGYSPSRREIMLAVDIGTTSLVTHHLWKLRNAGLLTWEEGTARTLRVIERESA